MIGIPCSIADADPPTGTALSLMTSVPSVSPDVLAEVDGAAALLDAALEVAGALRGEADAAADVVVFDDELEPHPVSTKAHMPAAPAPPAQRTVRRVR
jgi:hypothetical protein